MSALADDQSARPWPAAQSARARSGASAELRVPRERLLDTLLADSTAPVVVISAAAGSGKSTLAAQWAERDPRPHTVIALAPYMDDPAVLAAGVVDALECFGAPAPRTRAAITGTEPAFSAVLLPALSELAFSRDRKSVV